MNGLEPVVWTEAPRTTTPVARLRAMTVAAALFVAVAGPTALAVSGDASAVAIAVAAAMGLLLGRWLLTGSPPIAGLPQANRESVAPAVVLTAIAGAAAIRHRGAAEALLFCALALCAPVVVRLGRGWLPRAAAKVGRSAAWATRSVLFSLLGGGMLIAPWIVHGLRRKRAMDVTGEWVALRRRDPQVGNMWTKPAEMQPNRPSTARRFATALLVVAVAVAVIPPARRSVVDLVDGSPQTDPFVIRMGVGWSSIDASSVKPRYPVKAGVTEFQSGDTEGLAAMRGATWFPGIGATQGWTLNPRATWRPVNPYRELDFTSRYINVVDGVRASWRPPACSCHRMTVWMYGGSTMYGLSQRDDFTIASALAKLAYRHGLTVDVQNRGEFGQLQWMEAERFAWDLTVDPPPDMVIFYDGVNDGWAWGWPRDEFSNPADLKPVDPTSDDVWLNGGRSGGATPLGPVGSRFGRRDDLRFLSDEATDRRVIATYDRSRRLSRRTAERHALPVVYFWQPTRYDRPLVLTEPHFDTEDENVARRSRERQRRLLPPSVIDISDAFVGTRKPLFTDDVHHNEYGAVLVADAMWQHIGSRLETIAAKKGGAG